MLYWIIAFFILAVVAAALGLSGLASTFSSIAQFLALVFAVLFIASIVVGGMQRAAGGHAP